MKKIQTLLLAFLVTTHAHAASYFVMIPSGNKGLSNVNDSISVTLNNAVLPTILPNESYSLDLGSSISVTGDPLYNGTGVAWSSTNMLQGFSINNFGVLSGSTTKSSTSYSLPITATYKGKSATRTYSVDIAAGKLSNVVDVSTGMQSSCALTASGEVWCWGSTGYSVATKKVMPKPITAVTVGSNHACALANDGTAYCWGDNEYGQVGVPYSGSPEPTPIKVGLADIKDISAGIKSTCAVTINGSLYCWGLNVNGQLGNGTTTNTPTPTQIVGGGPGTYQSVQAAIGFACGITTVGSVNCWGWSGPVLLGNYKDYHHGYNYFSIEPTPGPVVGITSGVVQLALGMDTSCALISNGTIKCWGQDYNFGFSAQHRYEATDIGVTNATEIIKGPRIHCYKANNVVKCWGANDKVGSSSLFPDLPTYPGTMQANDPSFIPLPGRTLIANASDITFPKKSTWIVGEVSNAIMCFMKSSNVQCAGGVREGGDALGMLGDGKLAQRPFTNFGYVGYINK